MKLLFQHYINTYRGLSQESWMLSIVMLINRSGAMVMPFMSIYLHRELGYSLTDVGLAMSTYGVGALIGSWFGGWLCDRIGNYKTQLLSLFACTPLYFILPFFTSLYAISGLLFLLSIAFEIFRPANSVAIIRYARRENITRAFSLNRMALNLGFSIGPAIGGFLSEKSFYLLFFINGIACVVAAIVFIAFFHRRKARNPKMNPHSLSNQYEQQQPKRSPYTDYAFLLFTLFCAFFAIAFFQLLNTLPMFLDQGVGLSKNGIGLVMGFSGLVIVLLEMPVVAVVERRFTIVQVMVWGTLITALSFFLYVVDRSVFTIYVAMSLLSIGEILVMPFMSTITALRSGQKNKGAYMGVNGVSMGLGLIVSPYLGMLIAESYGYDTLWTGTFVLLVIAAVGYKYSITRMPEVQ